MPNWPLYPGSARLSIGNGILSTRAPVRSMGGARVSRSPASRSPDPAALVAEWTWEPLARADSVRLLEDRTDASILPPCYHV